MSLQLKPIPRVCSSTAAVRKITLTPDNNIQLISGNLSVIDQTKVFSIYFRSESGQFKETSRRSKFGMYVDQALSFFTPKKRFDVEYIITQLSNHRCAVVVTDWSGNIEYLQKSRMSYVYDSGALRSARNGYAFSFAAQTLKKNKLDLSSLIGTEIEPGDPNEFPQAPVPIPPQDDPPASNNGPGFYVEINPVILDAAPPATGNTTNLYTFVIAPSNEKYFIDRSGNSFNLGGGDIPLYHQEFTSSDFTGNTITVTVEDLPAEDKYIKVFLNGIKIEYFSGPLGQLQYSRNGQDLTFYKLTLRSRVNIYFSI